MKFENLAAATEITEEIERLEKAVNKFEHLTFETVELVWDADYEGHEYIFIEFDRQLVIDNLKSKIMRKKQALKGLGVQV
jgi:hypothetical protein